MSNAGKNVLITLGIIGAISSVILISSPDRGKAAPKTKCEAELAEMGEYIYNAGKYGDQFRKEYLNGQRGDAEITLEKFGRNINAMSVTLSIAKEKPDCTQANKEFIAKGEAAVAQARTAYQINKRAY